MGKFSNKVIGHTFVSLEEMVCDIVEEYKDGEDIEIYVQNVRYVRVQGILMGRGSGYSIREIQVYDYQNGDEKVTYEIPAIPKKTVVNKGKGSYVIDDANLLQPREL